MSSRKISVVVISRNEGAHLRRTVENLKDTLPGDSEVVIVDDGSTDASAGCFARGGGHVRLLRGNGLGVARARNLGAGNCRGDVLVFADAHITLPAFWWRPLLEVLAMPRVGAVAPAVVGLQPGARPGFGLTFRGPGMDVRWFRRRPRAPVTAPILPGCCVAMRREVFEASGGWDEGALHRGNIDNENSVRLWLLGYELMIAPETQVGHLFRRRSPYRAGWPEYLHNRMRLAFVHLKPERLARALAAMRNSPWFGEALLLVAAGDAASRRREWFARRVRDDDWFFERFGLKW